MSLKLSSGSIDASNMSHYNILSVTLLRDSIVEKWKVIALSPQTLIKNVTFHPYNIGLCQA